MRPAIASLLSQIASLPETERSKVLASLSVGDVKAILAELEGEYMQDPWLWFTQEILTVDEATQRMSPWPDKAYIKDLIWVLDHERFIFMPKSRRMMASWTIAAWSVYKTRFWPNHAVFVQSATEDKASYILDKRCKYIEDNLRESLLRRKYNAIKTHKGLVGRITYDLTQSYIWAIAQGDDVIRSFTFSILVMDESEFQDEGQAAFDAALSIAQEGGSNQLIVLSTSNGPTGVLADVCRSTGFTRFI